MKRNLLIAAALIAGAQFVASTAHATHPVTFIGPSLHLGYTDMLTEATAFSFAGEGGGRNYRGSATVGWRIEEDLRLKFTGEYMGQKLYYSFTPGTTLQWDSQAAIGARFEYDYFSYEHNPTVTLTGYYSDTPGKTLTPIYGHLARSYALGLAPGVMLDAWEGARVSAEIYYDTVRYKLGGEYPHGFGVVGKLNQALIDDFDFGFAASVRQPFNNYEANLNWTMDNHIGEWVFGFGAGYIVGKNGLPSSYNAMASVNLLADWHTKPATTSRKHKNLKDDYSSANDMALKQWTSSPAVYMPEVMTIARNAT